MPVIFSAEEPGIVVDRVHHTVSVAAPPERVLAVILGFADYPAWQDEVDSAGVLERDDRGRPIRVAMVAGAMGMKARYTLAVDHRPDGVEWHLLDGDVMTRHDCRWRLRPLAAGGTEIDIELAIGLKWPVPDFVLTRLVDKGVRDNLRALKRRAESDRAG